MGYSISFLLLQISAPEEKHYTCRHPAHTYIFQVAKSKHIFITASR